MEKYTTEQSEKKRKEIFDKLNELEQAYRSETKGKVEKPLQLERLTYERPADDELYEKAKASIEKKYGAARKNAEDAAGKKKLSLSETIAELEKQREKDKASIDAAYDSAADKVSADAVKRGVQRSSIATNRIAELEKEKLADKSIIDQNSKSKADNIRKQIEELSAQLEETLKASKNEEETAREAEFERLKKESDDKAEAVKKYNNSLEEKEVKYNSSAAKTPTDDELAKIKKSYDIKKVGAVIDYYMSFDDKAEAMRDFLSDPAFEEYLGDYYNYVFTVLKNRAD